MKSYSICLSLTDLFHIYSLKKEGRAEKELKKVMPETFPNLGEENINVQSQEAEQPKTG